MATATKEDVVRLTQFARCAGCAAKMGPGDLSAALAPLERRADPRILVGRETFDDAGVYQLSPELALVQTLDFFAPIVDDPYDFGRVAATNALSDVFAMGGEPITAMNIVGFPVGQLALSVLTDMLRGGQDAVHEAGAHIVGGHTITDEELKYGLSVTGTIHPAAHPHERRRETGRRARAHEGDRHRHSLDRRQARRARRARAGRAREVDDHAQRRREPRRGRDGAPLRDRRHRLRPPRPRVAHRAREQRDAAHFDVRRCRCCRARATRWPPARSRAAPRATICIWNHSSTGDVPRRKNAPSSWIPRHQVDCWLPSPQASSPNISVASTVPCTSAKCGSVLILVNGSVFKTDAT